MPASGAVRRGAKLDNRSARCQNASLRLAAVNCHFRALLGDGGGRFQREERDGLVDPAPAEIDPGHQFRNRKTRRRCLQRFEHTADFRPCRESTLDEVVRDVRLFLTAEKHPVSRVEGATGTPDLLVIGHHRARRLVMDHEGDVRLVETHPQRRRGH